MEVNRNIDSLQRSSSSGMGSIENSSGRTHRLPFFRVLTERKGLDLKLAKDVDYFSYFMDLIYVGALLKLYWSSNSYLQFILGYLYVYASWIIRTKSQHL